MVYKWEGYSYDVPAEVVGKCCEEIEHEYGAITSSNMVNAARSTESELHPLFEWDDQIAGEKWRNQQAKMILSSLRIVVNESEEKPIIVRAFVNVSPPSKNEAVYIQIEKAVNDESNHQQLLLNAYRELNAFQKKYQALSELKPLFELINALKED